MDGIIVINKPKNCTSHDVVRKAKRSAIRTNIGSCIGALGVLAPAIMLLTRKLSPESEYQVKKDVEAKLAQQQGLDTKGLRVSV